ncbi:MAG: phosphoribosylformylglycinamidine synthase subunit PurL [Actinobacteria bacterium]|nr:phosphoribosylformylglycinamidine synthase subunit PurL [Cyanobacteriota bacterium]MCL5771575.1 phosphoribosylformylglycinamidine synthase subunit PurL [Actinomycetota bacterium]
MFDVEKEYKKLGLKYNEFLKIQEYLGRMPNYLELSIYSVMWSEHCSYKSSKALLKNFKTTGEYVLQGPGENAGVLDIGDNQAIVFKMESHNHPSAVEPYQGAATGIGGIIRDIFAMGARPICSLNSLRFGKLDEDEHQKYLFEMVVKGIGDYGNCMGIPTAGGEVYFDETYKGNCLVNAMSVGIVQKDKLIKSRAFGAGNYVVLIGSSTGRDGIHGATFASDELNEESESRRPSVQVGDPFMEKVVLEVCLELIDKNLILGLQDMGAAGITSSSVEMASKGNVGLDIDVAMVPLREASMLPYEIMISESQERMLALVEPSKLPEVKTICNKWNINCERIGIVNDSGLYRIFKGPELLGEIPVKSLTDGAPVYHHKFEKPKYFDDVCNFSLSEDDYLSLLNKYTYNEIFKKVISSPNICSKKWVWEQYDHMVQTNTVLLPGHDSAVIRVKDTKKAIAFSCDGNGRYCYLDPYKGAIIAVAETARNLACCGAVPMGLTDCLNFGTPEKPGIFWQFKNSIDGIIKACEVLEIPVISGNVSFYNESFGKAIYPTPIIGTAGLIKDVSNLIGMNFKDEEDIVILIGNDNDFKCSENDGMGGSEFMELFFNKVAGKCPDIDLSYEKTLDKLCVELINNGLVKSAHDVSTGGIAVTIAESCISGNIGAQINIDEKEKNLLKALYNENQSRIVISANKRNLKAIKNKCEGSQIAYLEIGTVGGKNFNINNKINIEINEIISLYNNTIEKIMSK